MPRPMIAGRPAVARAAASHGLNFFWLGLPHTYRSLAVRTAQTPVKCTALEDAGYCYRTIWLRPNPSLPVIWTETITTRCEVDSA